MATLCIYLIGCVGLKVLELIRSKGMYSQSCFANKLDIK